jgi:hypothetical protein
VLKTYYTVVLDIKERIPLNLSLNTSMIFTPRSSVAVTGVPFGRANALVVPFKVIFIGSVPVVSAGNTSSIKIVKYPTGGILLKPKAKSTFSVPMVTFVVLK